VVAEKSFAKSLGVVGANRDTQTSVMTDGRSNKEIKIIQEKNEDLEFDKLPEKPFEES